MSEEFSGPEPGEAATTADAGLAERLIRDEFSEGARAHHTRFHREGKAEVADSAGAGAAASDMASRDQAVGDDELAAAAHKTEKVPVVGVGGSADETIAASAPIIHSEFAPPRAPRSRSHRGGMLAGLGVVGALLAVLVVLAPGGSTPRLPAQSVHDVSPITASGPKTEAATTPTTAAPTTTSPASASTTTAPQAHQNETISTFITYSYVPGTPAAAPNAAPSETTTTAPPQTTTTTTAPPQTTTTTAPRHCILGLIC
jgi:hypothetical protein